MVGPPHEPPEPATRSDLDALEERLEVHLAVYVDERLMATEARLSRTLGAQLAAQTRTLVVAGAIGLATAAVMAPTVVRALR